MTTGGRLTVIFKCECNPDKTYKSAATFSSHKKSKRHNLWEIQGTERETLGRAKEFENKISILQLENKELKKLNNSLKDQLIEALSTSISFEVKKIRVSDKFKND